ncbi:hypothetical protein DZE39_004235 [Clostridium beijerinckii]|nr:hypothetical protein [Clostridium beijerinckii]NRX71946.1 hypothetical protein [Clostridium beijerinckii]
MKNLRNFKIKQQGAFLKMNRSKSYNNYEAIYKVKKNVRNK